MANRIDERLGAASKDAWKNAAVQRLRCVLRARFSLSLLDGPTQTSPSQSPCHRIVVIAS